MTSGPCWAEISLSQLKENLGIVRRHVALERKILAVVKADAYGHGAVPCARALEEAGTDALGVASVAEGVELRQGGVRAPVVEILREQNKKFGADASVMRNLDRLAAGALAVQIDVGLWKDAKKAISPAKS